MNPPMVLIVCEESQTVCASFRANGIEAYSCDIVDCSGGHPEWHIKWDALALINGNCTFLTCDGSLHEIDGSWDLIIAHPPCTFLTATGNRWFNVEKYGEKALQRLRDREDAAAFFMTIWNAECDRVVIENPVGYMSTWFRKPDQIIHPYYFAKYQGDENCERKATCLWMRGVPLLKYTVIYSPIVIQYKNGKGTDSPWHMKTMSLPPAERARARSKTFPGIGEAFGDQWGGFLLETLKKEDPDDK